MSQFEDLLRKTVMNLEESYVRAETDFKDVVSLASEGIERVTADRARLALEKEVDVTTTKFTMYVREEGKMSRICVFVIPMKGFPIRVASSPTAANSGIYEEILSNKDELLTYFNELASDPDSRLALRIALILRTSPQVDTSEE